MYSFYNKIEKGERTEFEFIEQISLFGCNVGKIPYFLKLQIKDKLVSEPFKWSLDIKDCINEIRRSNQTIIINLKPKQKNNVSLYELFKVIGNCENGWTQIMLCLRGLLLDEDPSIFDPKKFEVKNDSIDEPIFSTIYLHGTVKDGRIFDKWTTPNSSSTNAILLWPHILDYFYMEAKKLYKVN